MLRADAPSVACYAWRVREPFLGREGTAPRDHPANLGLMGKAEITSRFQEQALARGTRAGLRRASVDDVVPGTAE
jgi:hypothetical protein